MHCRFLRLGSLYGLLITDAANNVIGGTADAERNVISGNGGAGVALVKAQGTRIPSTLLSSKKTPLGEVDRNSPGLSGS